MADYLTGTTNTRTLSGTISLSDGGGSWKSEGSAQFGGYDVTWTTNWYDYFSPTGDDTIGLDGLPEPLGRKVDLFVRATTPSNGFQLITTTITDPTILSGTYSITIPTREILSLGYLSPDMRGRRVPLSSRAARGRLLSPFSE